MHFKIALEVTLFSNLCEDQKSPECEQRIWCEEGLSTKGMIVADI